DLDRRTHRAAAGARFPPRLPPRAPPGDPRPGRAGGADRAQPADVRAEGGTGEGRRRSQRRGRTDLAPHRLRAAAAWHRARAGAESGAEFRVILPLYDAPPEVPEEESSGRPLRTRRILVVDKDPVVQRLVSALFASEGHLVEGARTGEQALRRIGECPYDLIISDA